MTIQVTFRNNFHLPQQQRGDTATEPAFTLATTRTQVLFPKPISLSNVVWLEKEKDNNDEEKIVQWYKGLLMAYQPFNFQRLQLISTCAQ